MYKLKTKSAAKKRFRVSANGKLRVSHAGKSHFMRHKSKGQLRKLRKSTIIEGQHSNNIKRDFLPYEL